MTNFPDDLLAIEGGAIIGVLGELPFHPKTARIIGPHDALDFSPVPLLILDHALALRNRLERGQAILDLNRFRRAGGKALLITYDEELLSQAADEVWWKNIRGAPEEVLAAYRRECARMLRETGAATPSPVSPTMRRGDGRAEVQSIELLGESGQPTSVWRSGEPVSVRVSLRFLDRVEQPVAGMLIRTRIGLNVYGTNTELERLAFGPCAAGETARITFAFVCNLCPGEYTLTVASHDPDGVWHDWLEDAVAFSVTDSRYTAGVANLRAAVSVEKT